MLVRYCVMWGGQEQDEAANQVTFPTTKPYISPLSNTGGGWDKGDNIEGKVGLSLRVIRKQAGSLVVQLS